MLAFQEPAAAARGVTLVRRVSPGRAIGDRERLKQVFHNLVVNALEASTSGGAGDGVATAAWSTTWSRQERATPGAASSGTLEKVFVLLHHQGGHGQLGLSIVRQLAERHGGRVEPESTEGKGTRVTVHIPAARLVATDEQGR
ncbi:MAG: HAMP domain-containing sensor histidine kinase [Polyangiales bacterium]